MDLIYDIMKLMITSKANYMIKVGRRKIDNRIMIPAIVRGKADENGFVTDELIDSYVKHARSGASLLTVEASYVEKNGAILPNQLGIYLDEHIDGLKRLSKAIKDEGVTPIIQLVHAGRMSCSNDLVAPSAIPFEDRDTPRELTVTEIERIAESFKQATVRACKAGFMGVEIHNAHGYLLSQFLSPHSNKRMDEYGGTLERRSKLLLDIVYSIRSILGMYRILSVRLGAMDAGFSAGLKIEDSKLLAIWLERVGVDLINVSINNVASKLGGSRTRQDMAFIGLSHEIKQVVDIPVCVAGGIRSADHVQHILDGDYADMVAICRAVLADPQFPNKVLGNNQDPIVLCHNCSKCTAVFGECPAWGNLD